MSDAGKRASRAVYRNENPLGGPAKMFRAVAERIESGEAFNSVMKDFGIKFESCVWKEDNDGNWETACGGLFVIETGTPTDNGMDFCCYCGARLIWRRA